MADIKTRDVVKGSIKTIDKAAVAGERMKQAYISTKTEQNTVPMMLKTRLMNMLLISMSVVLIPQFTKVSTNSTKQVVRGWKPLRTIFTKPKTA